MNIRINNQVIKIRLDYEDENQLGQQKRIEQIFDFPPFLYAKVVIHLSEHSHVIERENQIEIFITEQEFDSLLTKDLKNGIVVGQFIIEKDFKSTKNKGFKI